MGLFFNTIHIRKNEKVTVESLQQYYCALMEEQGFRLADKEEDAAISLFLYDPGSEWISICGDSIEFGSEEAVPEFCAPLSKRFSADVLAVGDYDSDYMFLNLVNIDEGVNAWANVGMADAFGIQRETDLEAWEKILKDHRNFVDALAAMDEGGFAEDALESLEPLFGLAAQQGMFCPLLVGEEEYEGVVTLLFSYAEKKDKEEEPVLKSLGSISRTYEMGRDQCVFVVNKGGASKGLAVAFTGNYVEHEDITFKNVQLEFNIDTRYGTRDVRQVALEKRQNTKGEWMLFPLPRTTRVLKGIL